MFNHTDVYRGLKTKLICPVNNKLVNIHVLCHRLASNFDSAFTVLALQSDAHTQRERRVRERQRGRDRQTNRQTNRDRHRQTDRQRQRDRQIDRQRRGEGERERQIYISYYFCLLGSFYSIFRQSASDVK